MGALTGVQNRRLQHPAWDDPAEDDQALQSNLAVHTAVRDRGGIALEGLAWQPCDRAADSSDDSDGLVSDDDEMADSALSPARAEESAEESDDTGVNGDESESSEESLLVEGNPDFYDSD